MGKKVYVGNLEYAVDNAALEGLFAAHGTVESVNIIQDRETGRSKGFGFVEMGSDSEAQAAIEALNGHDFKGRALRVNEAIERNDRNDRGDRGDRGGRGGYGGHGGRGGRGGYGGDRGRY